MMAQGPGLHKNGKPRPMGSRRIFPPFFKVQVLDSFYKDENCKGNQRATARKYGIHRRQIQKWLQCEDSLRAVVAESMRQEGDHSQRHSVDTSTAPERRAPRIYKNDARTLKLVAQKLYPCSYGSMLKDPAPAVAVGPIESKGEVAALRKTPPEYFVPKEYQFNDTPSEASAGVRSAVAEERASLKRSIDAVYQDLNLKDGVHDLCTASSSNSLVQKYSARVPEMSSNLEPRCLPVGPPPPPTMYHQPVFVPSHPLPPLNLRYSPPPSRTSPEHYHYPPGTTRTSPLPYSSQVVYSTAPADEPCNLVKPPSQPVEPPHRPVAAPAAIPNRETPQGGSPTVLEMKPATSPPTRIAELAAEAKTSAFSPKRKWLQDSLQEKLSETVLPPKQRMKMSPSLEEPKPKKPCPDFSIERLCGSPAVVKSEAYTPPSQPSSPTMYPTACHPPVVFPPFPPALLQHPGYPEFSPMLYKPEVRCLISPIKDERSGGNSPESYDVKDETLSDEEETIDILSTTPVENKTFDFNGLPGGKRRSFSVQFKLNVLDAFYNDADCNKNQRATARKFHINRRQVQKWLIQESELRSEGNRKKSEGPPVGEFCAHCPRHCGVPHPGLEVSVKHCVEQSCFLSDLKQGAVPFVHENLMGWPHPSALRMPSLMLPPWSYNHFDYPKIIF